MGNRLFTAANAVAALSADHIQSPDHLQESNELLFMLALLCKSNALTIVMQTPGGRGLRGVEEAHREIPASQCRA
eukprot:13405942-Alexandrium_andersonii.AAC.1